MLCEFVDEFVPNDVIFCFSISASTCPSIFFYLLNSGLGRLNPILAQVAGLTKRVGGD